MYIETSVVALLLMVALWPLVRKTRSWGARLGIISLAVAAMFGASEWKSRAHSKLNSQAQLARDIPIEKRDGFARSETCRSCHPEQYASWHRTFHRTMTQRATPEAVRGNFTNVSVALPGETFRLARRGDEFFVEMNDPDWTLARASGANVPGAAPRVTKRVTRTTGSHHMQTYWVPASVGNHQFNVPLTWLNEDKRWVPRNDVFLLPPTLPPKAQVWNNNCIGCHATAGQPGQDVASGVMTSRAAEFGIACEACHGPGDEHIHVNTNPRRRYAVRRVGQGEPTIVNPARVEPHRASEICSQCHAARYALSATNWYAEGTEFWKRRDLLHRPLLPGEKLQRLDPTADPEQAMHYQALIGYFWRDGQVRVSGREFNGLAATPCYQRGDLSCLSCHSMHKMADTAGQLARGMESNQACYQCHASYAKSLAQHTHHAANSSGSLCYNCHMPHTTYGLLKGIRSHQITSPTVKSSLETGRPNACNLCHLDQSLAWTAQKLNA